MTAREADTNCGVCGLWLLCIVGLSAVGFDPVSVAFVTVVMLGSSLL